MTLFAFTPARFAMLLGASVALAVVTNHPAGSHASAAVDPGLSFHVFEAVGQDNGSLTANLTLPVSYTPAPPSHGTDNRGFPSAPQGPRPVMRRAYPPLAR